MCILSKGIDEISNSDEEIKNLIASRRDDIQSLLTRYIKEIETFNPAYGLVGAQDTNELIIKHILDSLAPLGIIIRLLAQRRDEHKENKGDKARLADAGSGAGLPGIPLAIALAECDFTLIERMGRRAGFLLNTKAVLSLQNVNIEEKELEKIKDVKFDLITCRAFKPLEPKLLKIMLKICAPDGVIAAYKGKLQKIEAEMAPLEALCGSWEAIPCTVPFLDEERHILVIKSKI